MRDQHQQQAKLTYASICTSDDHMFASKIKTLYNLKGTCAAIESSFYFFRAHDGVVSGKRQPRVGICDPICGLSKTTCKKIAVCCTADYYTIRDAPN